MIDNQILNWKYKRIDKKKIHSLRKYNGKIWDCKSPNGGKISDKKNKFVKEIKKDIKAYLFANQKNSKDERVRCAYCGSVLGITSSGEIEHIANKARYPQFMFCKKNLVLACHLCNFPEKKGQFDVISNLNADYTQCIFKIVHPILDKNSDHFKWLLQQEGMVIVPKTDKGFESTQLFELNSEPLMYNRYLEYLEERISLKPDHEQIVKDLYLF